MDIVDGQMIPFRLSDQRVAYPILERCRELGIEHIAIHKAIPLDQSPADYYRCDDVDYTARDFPDLKFEIVQAGFALDEDHLMDHVVGGSDPPKDGLAVVTEARLSAASRYRAPNVLASAFREPEGAFASGSAARRLVPP